MLAQCVKNDSSWLFIRDIDCVRSYKTESYKKRVLIFFIIEFSKVNRVFCNKVAELSEVFRNNNIKKSRRILNITFNNRPYVYLFNRKRKNLFLCFIQEILCFIKEWYK